MSEPVMCEGCGKNLAEGSTICLHCGWDQSTNLARPPRPSLLAQLAAGGWRVVVYGLILLLPILGFMRLRTTGPGPDLETTLRWMVFGDGGRAAELETIHRMHEIASAASRYSIREMEMPPFDGDWEKALGSRWFSMAPTLRWHRPRFASSMRCGRWMAGAAPIASTSGRCPRLTIG